MTEFEREGVFDEDYLYFYAEALTEERSEREVGVIRSLLRLAPGAAVLDLACGHGRIGNRLAALGYELTGLDATPLFLEKAREDAAARGVRVEYVQGDMRELSWDGWFDAVLIWFTAFGYFDDQDNRKVLVEVYKALKPGGKLVIEMNHRDYILKHFQPVSMVERDGNLMIDRSQYEVSSGRIVTERIVVRDGKVRRTHYFVRFFTFPELHDWLKQGGFRDVTGYDRDGGPLTLDSRRMIVVAEK